MQQHENRGMTEGETQGLQVPLSPKKIDGLKTSESKLSLLTRATSFMTWDETNENSSRIRRPSIDGSESQFVPFSEKKHSILSLSSITILPTIYGSINNGKNKSNSKQPTEFDDNVSEFSYMTG